jgi:hypothetical protein
VTGARLAQTPSLAGLFGATPVKETGVALATIEDNLYSCRKMGRNDSTATRRTCTATNKRGEPCSARAVTAAGLCAIHGGLVDPKAIGRKGGSRSPLTKLRRAAGQDDQLREQARQVLSRALDGENVDKAQLDAARSLFAFRAAVPPASEQAREQRAVDRGGVFSIADLVRVAIERGILTGDNLLVGGEPVVVDPLLHPRTGAPPRDEIEPSRATGCPPAPATPERSEPEVPSAVLSGMTDGPGPDFDESEEAVLRRSYGSVTPEQWRWT